MGAPHREGMIDFQRPQEHLSALHHEAETVRQLRRAHPDAVTFTVRLGGWRLTVSHAAPRGA